PQARAALVAALLAGETPHPDQHTLRRDLDRLGLYWRRSGGQLAQASSGRLAERVAAQLAGVRSWDEFIQIRVRLDVDAVVPEEVSARLDALPSSVAIHGDRVPLDYGVEQGGGVARLRLREGQARRLQPRDLPPLDRPLRFTVTRGKHDAIRADSLDDLRRQLGALGARERRHVARPGRRRR
ncbi:MAG: DEAD/DEAH box helicase, partial [Gemmatimonadales bacterium]